MNAVTPTERAALSITDGFLVGLNMDMPADTYHSIQAMSAGGLKRMAKSPAYFYGMQLDPNRPPPGEPSPALVNGTLVHCALFEPDQVSERYVIKPDGMTFNTKEADRLGARLHRIHRPPARPEPTAHRKAGRAVGQDLGAGDVNLFLTDGEIADLCMPLIQPAAQVRYLRALGLNVTTKPNGRPVVIRSHAEVILSGLNTEEADRLKNPPAQSVQPNRAGLISLLQGGRARHGQNPKAQPA
jgi:hypothetical protein